MSRKLAFLNNILDQEVKIIAEQHRRISKIAGKHSSLDNLTNLINVTPAHKSDVKEITDSCSNVEGFLSLKNADNRIRGSKSVEFLYKKSDFDISGTSSGDDEIFISPSKSEHFLHGTFTFSYFQFLYFNLLINKLLKHFFIVIKFFYLL